MRGWELANACGSPYMTSTVKVCSAPSGKIAGLLVGRHRNVPSGFPLSIAMDSDLS